MTRAVRAEGARIGPCELVRRLGAGGMGEVWEVVLHGPAGFRKPAAIKLLDPQRTEDAAAREGLAREARLGALIQHPNVVGTYAILEQDGTVVLAMELVRGAPISELARAGPLPPAAVVEVGAQAAAGLAQVHALGLVHRDVKPANLLLDRTGLVKLADLGIAALPGEHAVAAGTPGYMAPEQADGRTEPRSDLFALAATLFALATGRRPFGAGKVALANVRDVERALATPAFLRPVEESVPGLAEVLRRCLRADPEARPPSARELGQELVRLRRLQPSGPTLLELLARVRPGLDVEGTPASEAPTRVLARGNLRGPRDRFFGRETELADLEARVRAGDERLLVVLGPGGMGKTRLALEVARRVQAALPGGAWVLDLVPARTADAVCAQAALALSIELQRTDPVGQIGRSLAGLGRALVVVDNVEQCVDVLPETLGRWLDAAPEVVFLCTSRVGTGLEGQRRVPLGELGTDEGVRLFVDRAPRPVLPGEDAEVRALVAALEGMPLAIELAAARLALMRVAEIRRRVGLALLAGGGAALPERHRSVAASIAWSFELLGPGARAALAELSVFDGGFGLEGAEAVLALPTGAPWAMEVLQELADASLLRVDRDGARFSMLAMVHAFASRQLAGPAREQAEARHRAHFARLGADEALEALDQHGGPARRRALAAELANLVAACRRAIAADDAPAAISTLRAAWAVLGVQGPFAAAGVLAAEVARLPSASAHDRARALDVEGQVHRLCGRPDDALTCIERALANARERSDRVAEGRVLLSRGVLHHEQGRAEAARADYTAALALLGEAGDRAGEAMALGSLGMLHHHQGRVDAAREHYAQALAAHRRHGDRRAEGRIESTLGSLDFEQGRPAPAREHYERALAIARDGLDRRTEAIVVGNLGLWHQEHGSAEDARALYEQAIVFHREAGDLRTEGVMLGNLGLLHLEHGRSDEALAGFEDALALHRRVGNRRSEAVVLGHLANLALAAGRLGEARTRSAEAVAAHRQVGNRRAEGFALADLGEVCLEEGRPDEARVHLDAALALHREVGNRRAEGVALALLARALAALGDRDGAIERLAAAESLLREVGDRAQLARTLAARAEVLGASDPAGAAAALAEAASLAPERADVARWIVRARSRVSPGG